MSKKRRREQPNVDTQLIEIYEDLANNNEGTRLKAAQRLLTKLAPEHDPSREQVVKVFKRLVRGLCSGRKLARLGFSIALTELLAQHVRPDSNDDNSSFLSIPDIVASLKELTHVAGSVSGQEERDHSFGRLFGSEAIVQSKVLFTSEVGLDNWNAILNLIFELARKKTWLREESSWVLFNSVALLGSVNDGERYAQSVVDKLHANHMGPTPEGIPLWLACRKSFPNLKFPKYVFRHYDPLYYKEKTTLSNILRESFPKDHTKSDTDNERTKNVEKGSWSSKPHFAWEIVFGYLLQPAEKQCSFKDLWKEALDEGLFSNTSSNERKHWGFSLVQRFVSTVPEELLPVLFTKNLGRCLINQLASKERFLNNMAERTLKAIQARAATGSTSAVPIINSMLDIDPNFDKLTKTKTVEKLLTTANQDTLLAIVERLNTILSDAATSSSSEANSSSVEPMANLLVEIVRIQDFTKAEDDKLDSLRGLVKSILGRFVQLAFSGSGVPTKLQETIKLRITSCLTHTIAKDSSDPTYFPSFVLSTIRGYRKALPNATDEIQETIDNGYNTLGKLTAAELTAQDNQKQVLRALKLLYAFTILRIYNDDTDAINILAELQDCCEALIEGKDTGDQDAAGETLVEILLSFVSKPSRLLRRLASQIMSVCSAAINASALESMLQILETKENSAGQESLFDRGDDDVEMLDASASSDGDEEESSGEESGSGSSDESEDDATLEAFDAKLAETLGTRRADDDLVVQGDESSDEDMNDEEMEALDQHLTTMFKQRKEETSKKKEKKDAKETVIQFKCRVLELLEIFIQQETSNHLSLSVVAPVLRLIHSTQNKEVSNKAVGLIQKYAKLYKLDHSQNRERITETLEAGRQLLTDSHTLAIVEGSKLYSSACSQASLLAAKAVLNHGGSTGEIGGRYSETMHQWVVSEHGIRQQFFTDFFNWLTQAKGRIEKAAK